MTRTAPRTTLLRLIAVASLLLAAAFVTTTASAAPGDTRAVPVYDQCSNDAGDGFSAGDLGCRWINGNLTSNNSTWNEGDSTVQRLYMDTLVPGHQYTVTLTYSTTKSGKHSYDFLTTFDASENWVTVDDRCQDIVGCTTATDTTLPIPVDPNAGGFDTDFGTRLFTMRGGTLLSATTPAIESGTYAGSSETSITVTFQVASSGSLCDAGTCGAALWFGAHVSRQADWGVGTGASSISGSPFHVAVTAIDGTSAGSRDNQMQGNAVVVAPPPGPGSLIITVVDVAGFGGNFTVRYVCESATTGEFSLSDGQSRTITGIPAGTSCTVTQTATPAAPDGKVWATPIFSPLTGTVIIPADSSREVRITNALTDPPPPPPPGPVPTPAPVAGLTVTKAASLSKSGPWESSIETEAGTPVWYRIVVRNSGQVALTGLSVKDSLTDDATPPDCPVLPASLAVGASWTCTYSIEAVGGTTINTVTADSAETAPATASADVFGAEGETLPATDLTGRTPTDPIATYAPLGLGLLFAALLVALAMGLPERRRK